MSRRKVLVLSNECLAMFWSAGFHAYRVVSDALPPDAKVINAAMDFDLRSVRLLVESSTFPEIDDGQLYPEIMPVFMTGDDGNGFTFTPSKC